MIQDDVLRYNYLFHVNLDTFHSCILGVLAVVITDTTVWAVKDIRLCSKALEVIQPDITGPCRTTGNTYNGECLHE